jgi:eukaryotic-like serine/threonine-protein kinase
VGRYEVIALLRAGGMGEVYRARDPRLGREVALKVVSEAVGTDGELLARLEREAKLGGSLNHPNVVAVFDVGLHAGSPYFVTELLQGETLRERLVKGAVPIPTALDWAVQMAQGLAAAHERGIIHRDLKPENVFLTRDGQVKLLDFGIAKLAEVARSANAPARNGLMDETASPSGATTGTGRVLGTPGYMSPEQVQGDPVDARTDFFSLGAVLFELLSGRRAFPSGPVAESGYAILHREPDPLPPTIPGQVAQVVHRCLEKEPAKRFQSARDLAFHLESLRTPTGPAVEAPAVPREVRTSASRWRRRGLLLAGAVALLGGAGAAYLAGKRPTARPPAARIEPITFRQGTVSAARFTADGRVVFSAAWDGRPSEIFAHAPGSLEAQPLGLHHAGLLGVSSAGELAVSVNPPLSVPVFVFMGGGIGTLAVVPGAGGAPRELAENVWYADWSPSGELAVVRVIGGKRQLEFPLGKPFYETSGALLNPRVSPRGDAVAVIHSTYSADELLLIDVHGQRTVLRTVPTAEESRGPLPRAAGARVFPHGSPRSAVPTGLAWSPNGEEVWFSSRDALWAASPSGGLRLVYQGLNEIRLEDISRAGTVLVNAQESRREITFVGPGGQLPRRLSLLGSGELAALSDDGRRVLFTEESPDGSFVTYLRPTDGSPPVKLGPGYALSLSPDERWALVLPDHHRNEFENRLTLVPVGVGSPRTLSVPGVNAVGARLLRDGKRAAFVGQSPEDKQLRIYVMPLEGGEPRPISPPVVPAYFDVSHDDGVAAALGLDQVLTLFPLAGGEPVRLPELGRDVVPAGWTEDGQLWARKFREVPTRLLRFDIAKRRVVEERSVGPIDPTDVIRVTRVRITPDGRSLAFDDERTLGGLVLVEGLGAPFP